MEIFSTFDFTNLYNEAGWIVIIYFGVVFAMLIDFITGVRNAIKRGEATTSRGFRRTAEKASLYFLPMICLTAIDAIATLFLDYPYLTAIWGVFNIWVEVKSIYENTRTTKQVEKEKMCAAELLDFITEHETDIKKLLK